MQGLVSLTTVRDRAAIGGKGANLAHLLAAGYRVPEVRAIPVAAFTAHVEACADAATSDVALRQAILDRPLDPELTASLEAFADEVGGRVSVRSSATLEDAHTHAFAGQFLTVLDVGRDDLADAVRQVWASVYSANVRAYLERAGLDAAALGMAVLIQEQLDSDASGVVMGDGERSMIEAVFGQGEAVVGAGVESDHWDVQNGRIVATKIGHKSWRLRLAASACGRLEKVDVAPERRDQPSLDREQVLQVAELAARLAQSFGERPQDGEFSFAGGELFVLQTRDVTASLPVEPPSLGPWTPPGKGAWELDETHFTRPVTAMFEERFPPAMRRGFQQTTERYGALLSHIDLVPVNRFMYQRVRPVAAPEDATSRPPPPRFVFKLLQWLHPTLRRRIATAERLWERREWRKQAEEWREAKERSIEAHLALQRIDLAALDDRALADHLQAVWAHVDRMIEQHHVYNLAALIPSGDLIVHAVRWSDGALSPADVLGLLTGSSAVSADLRSPDAARLAAAVAESPAARALLKLDDPVASPTDIAAAQALESLRSLDDAAGTAAARFLELREYRLTEGLDPAAPCLRELPTLMWRAVRDACLYANEPAASTTDDDALLERCRAAIPAEHRAAFDALLAEARATYHLRDERALYSDVWAWGILRSVCLEVGVRLHRRSPPRVVEPADAVQATVAELERLLTSGEGPSAQELEARAAFQRAYAARDAPPVLGSPPQPPPPADAVPAGAARVNEAVMTIIGLALAPRGEAAPADADELRGRPASAGVYEGTVQIVGSARDVGDLAPDAVLVVGASSSAFTMMAPLAAAVIAEGGGLLSHVAIVCREYRLPCVVGCAGITERVKTGDRVRVDGTHGTVTLLGSAATNAPR